MEGWILDVYPVSKGMCVWIIDKDGNPAVYLDPWFPSIYVKTTQNDFSFLSSYLTSLHTPFSMKLVQKREFFSGEDCAVMEIKLQNPLSYRKVADLLSSFSAISLFNADLNLPQYYFYERKTFPLAFCRFELTQTGEVYNWNVCDSPWTLDYPLPPLRYLHLALEALPARLDPNHKRHGNMAVTLGKKGDKVPTYILDGSEEELLHSLNRYVADWDPDIILTDWGDSYIFPRLNLFSKRTQIPLQLSRDPAQLKRSSGSRSFFSYGKVIYQAGDQILFGRLHIDTQNSFIVHQTQLDGLFEIARVARVPLQRAARSTIGISLSSMQHHWAIDHNYLIPIDKGQTEDFRTADQLIAADRGGLVYEPELGWHEDVIEYDFMSMYPEIMIRHNVTPEALNCTCCPDNKVPEIGHHICRHRIGMMPHVLAPLVKKRRQYKDLIQQNHPQSASFALRRDAFKWALVCCFGYLGFRNARFGKIEGHECVNAYSREAFLKAKQVAEEMGFHFLHGIVDSMWLKKPGLRDEEIEELRQKIETVTGLPLGFEGRYRWIHFCRSRTNPLVGVPNRYLGAFITGQTKYRGIELRRHDTPLFIKNFQHDLIQIMATARNMDELRALQPEVEGIVEKYRDRLCQGQVTPVELAISLRLTQDPSEYVHDTLSALAAKKIVASGVKLHAGEMIQYVVADVHEKVKGWRVIPLAFIEDEFDYDVDYYQRLLDRATEITPFAKKPSIDSRRNHNQLLLPL